MKLLLIISIVFLGFTKSSYAWGPENCSEFKELMLKTWLEEIDKANPKPRKSGGGRSSGDKKPCPKGSDRITPPEGQDMEAFLQSQKDLYKASCLAKVATTLKENPMNYLSKVQHCANSPEVSSACDNILNEGAQLARDGKCVPK